MELTDINANGSDDEDLEQLRLAALQSIKKCITSNVSIDGNAKKQNCYNGNNFQANFNKKGRGFLSRNTRMNAVNNRVRNTNLISITTVDDGKLHEENSTAGAKLVLPQDRYNNKTNVTEKEAEQKSKFNRYDNSDNSDSESDINEGVDEEIKLERTNSLEALMQELENEIQGDSKSKVQEPTKKTKVKKVKSKSEENLQQIDEVKDKPTVNDTTTSAVANEKVFPKQRPVPRKFLHRTPNQRRHKYQNDATNVAGPYLFQNSYPSDPYVNQNIPYNINFPYNQNPVPVIPPQMPVPIPNYPPISTTALPLAPLVINSDRNNIPMAPLSPRSAAFVLQNQKIIERRKKSPRRSYSRSPSPRYRSPTPRRSLSPRYNMRRSISPTRKFSKQSSLSPRTRSTSKERCNRRLSPKRPNNEQSPNEKRLSIRDRLGNRNEKRSRSPSIEKSPLLKPTKTDVTSTQEINPVLEARKKKFESKEIVQKEGVIRLKPLADNRIEEEPQDKTEEQIEEEEEDALLEMDDDVIDTNIDHLFSDEESDIEQEGRFKLKTKNTEMESVPLKRRRKSLDLERTIGNEKRKITRDFSQHSHKENKHNDKDKSKARLVKQRIMLKSDKEKKPVTSPIENKKIEIKIRNPSKYETNNKEEKPNKPVRRVEIAKNSPVNDDDDEPEPEIIIDNEDDVKDDKGGDLRAQISRKRAEKQKLPISENFKSRLLQNALEEVVYKQKNKKLKKNNLDSTKDTMKHKSFCDSYYIKIGLDRPTITNNFKRTVHIVKYSSNVLFGSSDARMPIHLRLGRSSGYSEKSRKKDLDQV